MTKTSMADTSTKLYDLLKSLSPDERKRAISATLLLLGDDAIDLGGLQSREVRTPPERTGTDQQKSSGEPTADGLTAKQFFESKQPEGRLLTKIEELAIAGHFRELSGQGDTNSRDELRSVVRDARRNFDIRHFRRDIDNAKKAGLFNRGADNTLSHYGQNYVDALPDPEKLKALRLPGAKRRGKKRSKSA
jgi:hypothetical protein